MLEFFARVLSALLVIVVVTIVLFISAVVTFTIKSTTDEEKMLRSNRNRRWFVYDLLNTFYWIFPRYLLRNVTLPYNPLMKSDGVVNAEILLISRGGVLVISTVRLSGYIDNPPHGDWIQYSGGNIIRMRNPSEVNEINVRAIRNILRSEDIHNVRVHNIIVYTDPNTQFKYHEDSLVSAEYLLRYTKDLSKIAYISFRDKPAVLSCIRKYRVRQQRPQAQPVAQNRARPQNINRPNNRY